jgi:uracil-DNA glycosylase
MATPPEVSNIWKQWHPDNGGFEGNCAECPLRDERGCRDPFYGNGEFNQDGTVDVMLVAESPGGANQADGPNKKSDLVGPDEFENRRFQSIADSFAGNSPYAQEISRILQEENDYSTYFTNVAKCNLLQTPDDGNSWLPAEVIKENAPVESVDKLNEEAKHVCENYLVDEIQALSPSVIVAFGDGKSVGPVYDLFDLSISSPFYEDVLSPKEGSFELNGTSTSSVIIPSYHFSKPKFDSNISHVGANSRDEYWGRLEEQISHFT